MEQITNTTNIGTENGEHIDAYLTDSENKYLLDKLENYLITTIKKDDEIMATTKKYVSLEKLGLYDEKIKGVISAGDATALQNAKDYADSLATNYEKAGAAATAAAGALADAQTYADNKVKALADGAVADNTAAIGAIKDGATIDSFADVEAALAGKQATGDYATKDEAKGYADAKDTAIAGAQAAADAAQEDATANAEAIEAINHAETGILAQAKNYTDTEAGKAKTAVDTLAGKVGTVPEGKTVMGIITNIQENAYDDTALVEKIDGVDGKVTTLIGEDANKSVRTIANEELAKQLIADGAAESLDTLTEIAAWIQNHPDDAAAMNEAIEALEAKVDTGDKTVSAYVTAAINALSIGDYAKAADLTALAGRVSTLETASATHALKTDVETVSTSLTEYKDAHKDDYTNAQIDAAIKVATDAIEALDGDFATDEELATAIENEVTRANGAYAAKTLETTVTNLSATVDTKAAQSDVNTISGKVSTLEGDMTQAKTDIDAVEAKAAANETNIAKKADKATTLTGYGITDAYTSAQTDTAIANAVGQFVEVSEEEINAMFTA